jgi:dCTP deaminase
VGILNDMDIRDMVHRLDMISPFKDYVEAIPAPGVISSGLSSFGYDARLGDTFKVFGGGVPPLAGYLVVDPKAFRSDLVTERKVSVGGPLTIRPHGFVLGYTIERFKIPVDVCALATGKSTYARCGLIVTPTPLEPGWEGHVTVEITNVTDYPALVYPGEGICQFQFHRGTTPQRTYNMRSGRYSGQGPEPVVARG